MKWIKFFLLGLIALSSCNDELSEGEMLSPLTLRGTVGNESATIRAYSPFANGLVAAGYFAKPDSYELLVSLDPGAVFTSVESKRGLDANGIKATGLVNGTPYYFTLLTHKEGLPSGYSDTIMVIPSQTALPERLLVGFRSELTKVTLAPDGQRVAFLSSNVNGFHTVDLRLYTYDKAENTEAAVRQLEAQVLDAEWSPAGDIIAAVRGTAASSEIVVIESSGGTPRPLPLQISNPELLTFSPDGVWLVYAGHNGDYRYQVWRTKPDGSENEKIFDAQNFPFIRAAHGAIQGLDISNDNEDLFLSILGINCFGIYKYDIPEGELKLALEDGWCNTNLSLSPDNSSIAFFSSRSGASELWLYHFEDKTLSMLTGKDEQLAIIPAYSKLVWIDNATVMFTAHKRSIYGITNKVYQVRL